MVAEVDVDAFAAPRYGVSSPDRMNHRNGYRHRDFDTRAGTLDVAIPKLRSGSLFGEHGADESDQGGSVGEDADHVGAAADLAVEPFLGVVGPDLAPQFLREAR